MPDGPDLDRQMYFVSQKQRLGRENQRHMITVDANEQIQTPVLQATNQFPVVLEHAMKPLELFVCIRRILEWRPKHKIRGVLHEPSREPAAQFDDGRGG